MRSQKKQRSSDAPIVAPEGTADTTVLAMRPEAPERQADASRRSPPPLPRNSHPGAAQPEAHGPAGPREHARAADASSTREHAMLMLDEDVALSPVERQVAASISAHKISVWWGWLAASVVLVGSGAHYVLVHRPLQEQSERVERARARVSEQQAAQVAALESDLTRVRSELEQANATAAAQRAAVVAAAAASEEAEIKAPEPAKPSRKSRSRAARRERPSSRDARARPPATESSAPNTSQPLRGILSSSNDPLEGL